MVQEFLPKQKTYFEAHWFLKVKQGKYVMFASGLYFIKHLFFKDKRPTLDSSICQWCLF